MLELNIKFQEKYKQLDALCKDIFSSKDGVSMYINAMQLANQQLCRYINEWEYVFKQLKYMRSIRNKLAHEVGAFDLDLCTEYDLRWLDKFYSSILNRTDPLTKIAQMERQRQSQQNSLSRNKTQNNNKVKTSVWGRIKAKIKSWFS